MAVRSRKFRLGDVLTYIVLLAWSAFVLFPLFWIATMSFKREIDIFAYPPKFLAFDWSPDNYLDVFGLLQDGSGSTNFPRYFLNSIAIVGGALALTVLLGTIAAYALARLNFRGRDAVGFLLILIRMVPVLTVLLPLYVMYRDTGLYNTYLGLILVYLFIGIPFYTWLVRGHVAAVPKEIEEAAIIDGCGTFRMLFRVVVPVMMPGLVSAALLALIYMWNNFLFALILAGPDLLPVTTGLLNYLGYSSDYGNLAAACVVTTVPVILIGIFIQRYIVGGLSGGAVKG
ncbi:MAG: carbohydrate ABC transporter permease [Bauldia sp.]|uniref:carbohydrate ABC transporter permease n=1 Tax=Bauldia sp. TaxID=2575872 RepID=UPI001D8147B4|nr:carbohydrate ABC transporter permease [Bauldia sp.]MCB1497006.1 carbohydrate ABC transporter permease [Bauldia sp.]